VITTNGGTAPITRRRGERQDRHLMAVDDPEIPFGVQLTVRRGSIRRRADRVVSIDASGRSFCRSGAGRAGPHLTQPCLVRQAPASRSC
jgi:hypothetical protein